MTIWQKLSRGLRSFCSDRSGNVALTFGATALIVIGSVGAAIDYSRANLIKAKMQGATDSVALMLSNEAATDTDSELQASAARFFSAVFNPPGVQNIAVQAIYSNNANGSGGTTVVVNGSAAVPTTIAGILGIQTITVRSTSTVKWGSSRLQVALVLDNTGSMAQAGKMAALQDAARSFLTQLSSAATTNGDIYVSIVPFAKDVNLNSDNSGATWIDWTDWDANNGTCSNGGGGGGGWGGSWWGRGGRGGGGWGGGFGSSSGSMGSAQSTCSGNWNPKNHNTWNGCVTDRGGSDAPDPANYDTNAVAPTTTITATLFSAEQYDSCPQPVKGLSYDWSGMNTLINNMSPDGNTNQAIGLALGWMSLVGGGPFTVPVKPAGYTYHNIIVLFTDGLNTEDRWYTDAPSIDARQRLTCQNAKAAGITIYTVQISTDGTGQSQLLQDCATDPTKFFFLTSASQLVTTFNQIGTNLTNLRIAR